MGGQTVRRKVLLQGLPRNLNATISPDAVDVILSGPLPSLQNLSADTVQVVIDGAALLPGTFSLRPRIIQIPEQLKVRTWFRILYRLSSRARSCPYPDDYVTIPVTPTILVPAATPTFVSFNFEQDERNDNGRLRRLLSGSSC